MFKLFMFLIFFSLTGCTQHQRFALRLNAQLDACAMKRMSESKFNSQQGYLQAHFECHRIVNIDKAHALNALNLERIDTVNPSEQKDELEQHGYCWEFVKGLVIDKNYPDLRLIGGEPPFNNPQKNQRRKLTDSENRENLVIVSLRRLALPNKLSELNKKNLLLVRDTMQTASVIGHDTLCSPRVYNKLSAIIGREVHRRYPQGVDGNFVGDFK